MNNNTELEYRCTGRLKVSKKGESELITFSLPIFGGFEIACICTVPADGEDRAPVYVKLRQRREHKPSERNPMPEVSNRNGI